MSNNTNYNKSPMLNLLLKSMIIGILLLTFIAPALQAQQTSYTRPSWWIGAAGGANFSFSRGSTQQLNDNFKAPVAFHNGLGIGHYVAPLVEFYAPGSRWGMMLQVGQESRKVWYDQKITPCNCPADLSAKLAYVTIEPSLRFAPFKSNFFLYGGPRLAINFKKPFTYKLGINPAFPDQVATPDVKGDLSNVNKTLLSMQIGAGYDIPLVSQLHRTQLVLAPFVSFQPYFGQSPRSIETWNITNLRVGAALKFGVGHAIETGTTHVQMEPDPTVQFTVSSPKNIPIERRVREIFPLRNYVFFDIGSTSIPNRYVLLTKDQVKDFKEDQLETFAPKSLSGRSERGMVVYYNLLNILGDRMGKNPTSTINLVGSSEKGVADAQAMANSIKQYLVVTFGIAANRISVEGRDKPKIPSEQPGGTRELELLHEGDRRVSIESSSPALLMEFQSGTETSLKPVEFIETLSAPPDSYVKFEAKGSDAAYSSWLLEIRDDAGKTQTFGPYMQERVSIPGKSILGARPSGTYKVTMVGTTLTGRTETRNLSVKMALWTPPKYEEGMRYSVIFEFNESKTIPLYQKYITEVIVPKIPKGATVIIHGYTDIIGDAANNQKLSFARAQDVMAVFEKALAKSGRKDIHFEVFGFGEDQLLAPFDNQYPEERFYNRTVLIDIIPK